MYGCIGGDIFFADIRFGKAVRGTAATVELSRMFGWCGMMLVYLQNKRDDVRILLAPLALAWYLDGDIAMRTVIP